MNTSIDPGQPLSNQPDEAALRELEARLLRQILARFDFQALGLPGPGQSFGLPEAHAHVETLFNTALAEENIVLSEKLRRGLLDSIAADVLGFGPLEPLLADATIFEILIDGYNRIYVEREGGKNFEDIPSRFRDDQHLLEIIHCMGTLFGQQVNESNPIMDVRLSDGTRLNIIIPPIALNGPTLTIRKFAPDALSVEDLLRFGSWNKDIVQFLHACVLGRLNIVVAGGTGSGKTTILRLIANMIPNDERIINVQFADELALRQKYVVTLESRPPNLEGKGEIAVRDLVINALKMRPDRIIAGEVRRGEALDLLDAINTGHDGCMFTIHATTPHDTLARLEVMATLANPSIPLLSVRQMMASALDLIVQQERLRDGSRKIVKISEVEGMQGDAVVLSDIFEFRQSGMVDGKIQGHFTATGRIPKFLSRLNALGVELPLSLFTPR